LFLVFIAAGAAHAQEFPRWEASGGFSYANVNLAQAGAFSPSSRNFYGFDLAFSFNPNKNIRLLADVGVQSGKTTATPPPMFTKVHLDTSQALFGPQFTLRRRRATAFANLLVGVANTRSQGQSGTLYDDLIRRTNFALGFGGGVDLNWRRLVGVRLFQAEYVPTRLSGSWETHYTLSTGLVFKFGYR